MLSRSAASTPRRIPASSRRRSSASADTAMAELARRHPGGVASPVKATAAPSSSQRAAAAELPARATISAGGRGWAR